MGGMNMPKNNIKNTLATAILIVTLGIVLGATAKNAYSYYTGPNHIVDTYLRCLKEKNYNRIFSLLDQESLQDIGGRDEITAYYKQIYEQKNKLIDVQELECRGQTYTVKYLFNKGNEQGKLSAIKKEGKWYIEFPFEESDVEIFAPYGAKVYLDSKEMIYSDNKSYKMKNVLPGTYLLKVDPIQEEYEPYYKMLEIPFEKSYIVPYDLAHVTVNVAPQLVVNVSSFSQLSEVSKVEFDDLLLGKYQIEVQDTNAYLNKQEVEVEVKKGENVFTLRDFKLSKKGEEKLENFLRQFYGSYLEGIKTHNEEVVASYFEKEKMMEQLRLYSSWYIDKKNISDANISIKIGDSTVDEKGILHTEVTENIDLYNKEYDEIEEKTVTEIYKVIIRWNTSMHILDNEWQIIDREIEQSIVAVKDKEGRWIQY